MTITINERGQEIMSRYHDSGVDWGAPRRIIARTADGKKRLVIRQGHTDAVGAWGFGRQYHPAVLVLEGRRYYPGGDPSRDYLTKGGRITNRTLEQHAVAIAAAFGEHNRPLAFVRRLDVRTTTVIGCVQDASS